MRITNKEVSEFKVGDIFYECSSGFNLEARVTVAPTETVDESGFRQWEWQAVNTQNESPISYLICERYMAYAPKLYRSPQYMRLVGGDFRFELIGGM